MEELSATELGTRWAARAHAPIVLRSLSQSTVLSSGLAGYTTVDSVLPKYTSSGVTLLIA